MVRVGGFSFFFSAKILISVLRDLFPVLNLQLNKCIDVGVWLMMFESQSTKTPPL